MHAPENLLLAILLVPLCSALLIALLLRRSGGLASWVSVGAAGVAMLLTLRLVYGLWADGQPAPLSEGLEWMALGELSLRMGFFVDPVALVMLTVVTFVGFWIHVFSLGYMAEDPARGRYFGGLSLFMFSMLGIVLADNLFMIFIFWELVGFSSYMLIAHYCDTPQAREASKKAFIVNRVGDLGMLLGILWAWQHWGTVQLQEMAELLAAEPERLHAGIALLLMCGFIGKSAQFPLHVWLPDAMAGPTPVSALIHAATMVAAGIYFLCRIAFLMLGTVAQDVILYLGAAMALYAGLCAFAQTDIKRILAYSTLSQLGYMAAAFGLGLPWLALFHTVTHAFFKALLFLGSGSVIHACHHEQDIYRMGGLWKKMPVTTLTFLIGTAALCGLPFLSGYYSKDAIIEAAWQQGGLPVFLLVLSAFLTAAYMGRLVWTAFFGSPRGEGAAHAHESPWPMLLPLIVLAVCSVFGGMVSLWPQSLSEVVAHPLHALHEGLAEAGLRTQILLTVTAAWAGGLLLSFLVYRPGAAGDCLEQRLPLLYRLLGQRLWFDEGYNWYVAKVQQRLALILNFFDMVFIGGLMVRGAAGVAGMAGIALRALHTGNLRASLYWFFVGFLLLVGVAIASRLTPIVP